MRLGGGAGPVTAPLAALTPRARRGGKQSSNAVFGPVIYAGACACTGAYLA